MRQLSVSWWFYPHRWRTNKVKHGLRKRQCNFRIIFLLSVKMKEIIRALEVSFTISKTLKKLYFKVYEGCRIQQENKLIRLLCEFNWQLGKTRYLMLRVILASTWEKNGKTDDYLRNNFWGKISKD